MTLEKLRKYTQDNKGPDKIVVVVGYAQNYALEQEERTDFHHRVGQAKYLETAVRTSEPQVVNLVRKAGKENLADALLKGGLLIQRESQLLVPVDTSALKASAFTTIQEELEQKASEANARGEAVRLSSQGEE